MLSKFISLMRSCGRAGDVHYVMGMDGFSLWDILSNCIGMSVLNYFMKRRKA